MPPKAGHFNVDERRDAWIAELTVDGYSARQISAIVGVSPRGVVRARYRTKTQRPFRPHMTPEEIARAEEMISDGVPQAEVARTLGRSLWAIGRRFRGRGVNPGVGRIIRDANEFFKGTVPFEPGTERNPYA